MELTSVSDLLVNPVNMTVNMSNYTALLMTTLSPKKMAPSNCDGIVNFITHSLIAGVLCLLGFIGNSVSYVVLRMDSDSRVAGFLLQVLAFSDNLFLATWFLHFTLNVAFRYFRLSRAFHITWLYVRIYTYPVMFIAQTATIWLTVLIAASRYIAVCRPYSAARYCSLLVTKKIVAAITVFSLLYNVPRFFEVQVMPRRVGKNRTRLIHTLVRTQFGKSALYRLIYFDILYIIITFVLPLVLLLYLNTRLIFAYRVIQRRRRTMRMRHEQHDHSITLVMIMVVVLFIACNAPARVVQMIWQYEIHHCPGTPFFLITLSNVLEVLNSSSNFIIYCVFRKQFRKNLKKQLCPGAGRKKKAARTEDTQLNGMTLNDCKNALMRTETEAL